MQNDNRNNGQPNQRPVRPQGQRPQQGQRPVRPQMQGQQPVRPQMQGQRPVRPEYEQSPNRRVRPEYEQSPSRRQQPYNEHEQSPSRRQQPYNEYEQSPSHYQQQQYSDNNFEDLNAEIVNDTVAENKARGKKQKVVKQKKVLTPEQKKKRLIIVSVVAAVVVLGIIAWFIVGNLLKKNNQHIIIANNETQQQEVSNEQNEQGDLQNNTGTDETITDNTDESVQEEVETHPVVNIQAKECSESSPLGLDEYTYMDLIVNTKTAEDKAYTDREAKVYTKLSKVVTGYDEVAKYIQDYNETNTQNKNISLPSSLDYYKQSNGTEMVMFEFELLYPADFPTSASSGYVYRIPQASIEVFGTLDDIDSDEIKQEPDYNPSNYIVVDDIIYNVSKITDISVYERNADKGIKIGEPIIFRYVTALPVGASSDVYGFKINVDLDIEDIGKDSATYWFSGQSISASDKLIEAQQQIAEQSEQETDSSEDSEDNAEESNSEEELEDQ